MCATLYLYLDWISSMFYFPLGMGNSSFSSSHQVLICTFIHDFVIHSSSKCLLQLSQWHTSQHQWALIPAKFHFLCCEKELETATLCCLSFKQVTPFRRPLPPISWKIIFLKQVGDVSRSLLEIQVEYIKKNILFLTLWRKPSKKTSNLRSLTLTS